MGLLGRLLYPEPKAAASPIDDYWYQPADGASYTGARVNADTAMRVSTVYRCIAIISQSLASLPLFVYHRLENGGKEKARGHPLYGVLHDQPNRWQTSFEWREMMQSHALFRGNGFSRIIPGRRGFVDQLIPLQPDRMRVEQLRDGRLRYLYRDTGGKETVYDQDEMFHVRGLGSDGIVGFSVLSLARQAFGLALATEEHGARLFGQGTTRRVALEHPGELSKPAQERLRETYLETNTGLANSHKPIVLEEGLKVHELGMTSDEAQFLETRGFSVEEIARWFGVPLSLVGHTEKATSWGTGLEQLNLAFVIHTMRPWFVRWEQAIGRDLILDRDEFFAEFLVDALARGDMKSRYESHRIAVMTGWKSRNEARAFENMNPVEGLDGFLAPQNMALVDENGDITPINQSSGPPPPMNDRAKRDVTELLAYDAARRVVVREVRMVRDAAKRTASDAEGFDSWLASFYDQHAEYVAEALHIDGEAARAYCERQRQAASDLKAVEQWEAERPAELVDLILRRSE